MSTSRGDRPGAGALPGSWDGLVVIDAANWWDGVRLADQQLAASLSRQVPVLYVDPPISHLTLLRHPELKASLEGPRLRLLGPSLARLTPIVPPGRERPGITVLTTRLTRRAVRSAVGRLGGPVHALLATSGLHPLVGAAGERTRVYWAQDDFVGGAALFGQSAQRLRRGELRLAAAADLVIAANPAVAERWSRAGHRTVLVPYGCDAAHFATTDGAPLPEIDLAPPIAGFVGHLADRIDLRLLEAVADRGVSLLLVGPRHPRFALARLDGLLARPNVRWVGGQPFELLPSWLKLMSVGLVPYTGSAFNRGSFPLKMLEYLAAGRPVVATDLPATRWLRTPDLTCESEPQRYADAVVRVLRRPASRDDVSRMRAYAADHSWDSRATAVLAALREVEGRR